MKMKETQTKRTMDEFVLALVPGSLVMMYIFGLGILINILTVAVTVVLCEYLFLKARGMTISTILDGSALATGLLFALTLPPLLPISIVILGVTFTILIVKHVYGGSGNNLFNPAMAGFAALVVSFPMAMSSWGIPFLDINVVETLEIKIGSPAIDGTTRATPLHEFKFREEVTNEEYWNEHYLENWRSWAFINLTFLFSGSYLLYKGLFTWYAPVAMLSTITLLSLCFYDGGSSASLGSPIFHLFSGATMLGAFFILTDPVTSPKSSLGQTLFGIGIGMLTFAIRTIGGYPEGLAFAVLLMNAVTPLINRLSFNK